MSSSRLNDEVDRENIECRGRRIPSELPTHSRPLSVCMENIQAIFTIHMHPFTPSTNSARTGMSVALRLDGTPDRTLRSVNRGAWTTVLCLSRLSE